MTAAPQNPKIVLPPERFRQLLDIRDTHGFASMSDALRELIRTFHDQHRIPHSIPGIEIYRASDGITIRFDSQEPFGMTLEAAQALADAIRAYGAQVGPRKKCVVSADFEVSGFGRAVTIKWPHQTEARQMAPDVASEFADILEKTLQHKAR